MINRILKNWTWIRAIYFLIGVYIIIQSAIDGQWIGILFGAWPTAMGLFSLGCAAGNCETGNCDVKPDKDHVQE